MSKERCHENAFCEVCRFGDFNGKCFAVESQREIVAHYGGYEQFELMGFCLDKDQRIAELEEQLKNAIVPKFKIGQNVWFIDTRVNDFNENKYMLTSFKIETIKVDNFDICYEDYWGDVMAQRDLFATKEEAQAKLKELQGESL